jgi:hypothetical protein
VRGFSPFSASLPGFLGSKLMRAARTMSGLAALAGNFALLVPIHGSKPPSIILRHMKNKYITLYCNDLLPECKAIGFIGVGRRCFQILTQPYHFS